MTYDIYKVTITPPAPSSSTLGKGGFLDNKTVQQYGLVDGLTFEQCKDKRRANLRWNDIVESINMNVNPFIGVINAVGGNVSTSPSSFYFEIHFEAAGHPSLVRDGEMLTGIDALQRMIAEGMITDSEDQCEVFDPTMTDEIIDKFHLGGVVIRHIAVGPRFLILDIGRLADDLETAMASISIEI